MTIGSPMSATTPKPVNRKVIAQLRAQLAGDPRSDLRRLRRDEGERARGGPGPLAGRLAHKRRGPAAVFGSTRAPAAPAAPWRAPRAA